MTTQSPDLDSIKQANMYGIERVQKRLAMCLKVSDSYREATKN